MKAIIDMISGFFDLIGSLIDFVVGFFADLIYVIKLLGSFLLNIPSYFSWLPSAAIALMVTAFGVVVIYMVLNRK